MTSSSSFVLLLLVLDGGVSPLGAAGAGGAAVSNAFAFAEISQFERAIESPNKPAHCTGCFVDMRVWSVCRIGRSSLTIA